MRFRAILGAKYSITHTPNYPAGGRRKFPAPPETPRAAYQIFSRHVWAKKKNVPFKQVTTETGKLWKKMTEDEKKKYVDLSEKERKQYHKDLCKFVEKNPGAPIRARRVTVKKYQIDPATGKKAVDPVTGKKIVISSEVVKMYSIAIPRRPAQVALRFNATLDPALFEGKTFAESAREMKKMFANAPREVLKPLEEQYEIDRAAYSKAMNDFRSKRTAYFNSLPRVTRDAGKRGGVAAKKGSKIGFGELLSKIVGRK